MKQIYVKVGLWIKADTDMEAKLEAEKRLLATLNDWFIEIGSLHPPFPTGSLLFYNFITEKDLKRTFQSVSVQ